MSKLTNNIKNYTGIGVNLGPVHASDLISNKYAIVHEKLYRTALNSLISEIKSEDETVDDFKKTHKCIEIKHDEYLKPSDVLIVNTQYPFGRKKYDLTDYWNTVPEKRTSKDMSLLHVDEDTIKYAELVYIDYIQGKCKFRSKLNGEEFWTGFDYINEDTIISDDFSLENTFTYKLQNNKIG